MYGMVHQALEDMVVEHAGRDAWNDICEQAGSSTATFPSLSSFPDELTVGLVVASADRLGRPVDQMLVEFGRRWVGFALTTAYGPLLRESGDDVLATLRSLDGLHARVAVALPELRPPSFNVVGEAPTVTVEYYSPRDGLADFVVGLLHGLGDMHGVDVEVVHTLAKGEAADHDEFTVSVAAGL